MNIPDAMNGTSHYTKQGGGNENKEDSTNHSDPDIALQQSDVIYDSLDIISCLCAEC